MNDRFRVYTSADIVGVELSGALKNVVALACGVCDGMGYQDNTKALLMTRAMAELSAPGRKAGRYPADLRRSGRHGRPDRHLHLHALPEPPGGHPDRTGQVRPGGLEEVGAVVEGYYAAASIHQLAQREGVEMPICRCVYEVLYHGVAVQDVVSSLMRRAKKDEIEDGWRYPVG